MEMMRRKQGCGKEGENVDYTVKSTKMYRSYAAEGSNADKLAATIKPLLDDTVTDIIIRKWSREDGAPFIGYARVLIDPTRDMVSKTDVVIIDDMEAILGYKQR